MKLLKILLVTLVFSGSIFTFTSVQAAQKEIITVLRVRTVPGSSDQKKKDTNTVKQPANSVQTPARNCSQSKSLLSSRYIGNGGLPK